MSFIRNPKDVLSGLLFLTLAGIFAWEGSGLNVGTANRMGPGYFPLLLSGLLGLLGLMVLVNGLKTDGAAPSGITWRALSVLTVAIVFFGFAMQPLGFVPTIAISVLVSTFAGARFSLTASITISAIMTVFTWAVFILGLGLPLPLLGPWLGGY